MYNLTPSGDLRTGRTRRGGVSCWLGTVVEGEWDEGMALIRTCHLEVLKRMPRLLTTITIDDRPGKPDRITEKIRTVEKKLGRELKK
jgi:hypothetical protein